MCAKTCESLCRGAVATRPSLQRHLQRQQAQAPGWKNPPAGSVSTHVVHSPHDAMPHSSDTLQRLREVLSTFCIWPGDYTFKFVVPRASANHLIAILDGLSYTERPSRAGKFLAFTVNARMESSEAVISLYQRAAEVEGLLAF